VEEWHIPSVQL